MDQSSISASLRLSTLPETAAETSSEATRSALEEEVLSLFEQFRARLLRYLITLGLNAHDGEEVVQEVFLALFCHLRQGKSRRNLRGWIFRVGHNLGLRQRNRMRQQVRQTVEIESATDRVAADTGPDPEQQMLWGERQDRLLAVVRALPEQDQWCLHLRAEGLRYREIAEALGISLGSVSLSLGRSIARLARVDGR